MVNILQPAGFECVPAAFFKRLGFVHHVFDWEDITELTQATCEIVYLLPIQAMDTEQWPRLRVRFARANRP